MTSRPRAYLTRRLPEEAVAIVADACEVRAWPRDDEPVPREVLLREISQADGLLAMTSDRVDAELVAAAPRLRVVANMAVGYDNADVAALTARRVVLTNTPDVLTETTADLAWALILAAARRVVEGHKLIDAGRWKTWSPTFMVGQDVHGATLGVVGAGRIGAAVLRRGTGFGMTLRYHNRRPAPELERDLGASWSSLDQLLAASDVLVVAAPLTDETRGMIGSRELALMKPTSVLVNVSRGPLVDEAALRAALDAGRPWAAGLDVFAHEPIPADHPLLAHPRVVAVPHIGSASVRTRVAMATTAARNLVAVLQGRRPPNAVNPDALT